MYSYIKGIVAEINSNYIVIDNNGIGYLVFTPNPFAFKEGEKAKCFIYQHIKEEENSLYGFKTIEEKEMFLKLMSVKGVGPKMTLPILATGSIAGIVDAIERENILYLKKFPKIGDKVAKQIILDLKGKLNITVNNSEELVPDTTEELIEVLEGLGYKLPDIKRILPNVNKEQDIGAQVKEALRLMMK